MNEKKVSDKLTLIQRVAEPGKHLSLYATEDIENTYSDGIAGIKVGPAISKVEFFVTEAVIPLENGEFEEKRVIRLSVALPTLQLLQGISQIISQSPIFAGQMENVLENLKNETVKELKKFSGINHVNP